MLSVDKHLSRTFKKVGNEDCEVIYRTQPPPLNLREVTGVFSPLNKLVHMASLSQPGEPLIPSEYRDLTEAFSEKECHIPHCCTGPGLGGQ